MSDGALRGGGDGELAGERDLSMCRSSTSFSLSSPDDSIESASEFGLWSGTTCSAAILNLFPTVAANNSRVKSTLTAPI